MSMVRGLALLALALLMGADKAEPEPKPAKPPKADIRGTAKEVAGAAGPGAWRAACWSRGRRRRTRATIRHR